MGNGKKKLMKENVWTLLFIGRDSEFIMSRKQFVPQFFHCFVEVFNKVAAARVLPATFH